MRAFIESARESDLFEAMDTNIQQPAEENDPSGSYPRVTPMRLLIRQFPDLAKDVLDRCLTTNHEIRGESSRGEFYKPGFYTPDDEDFTIVFRYSKK